MIRTMQDSPLFQLDSGLIKVLQSKLALHFKHRRTHFSFIFKQVLEIRVYLQQISVWKGLSCPPCIWTPADLDSCVSPNTAILRSQIKRSTNTRTSQREIPCCNEASRSFFTLSNLKHKYQHNRVSSKPHKTRNRRKGGRQMAKLGFLSTKEQWTMSSNN